MTLYDRNSHERIVRDFRQLPVRIGRNDLNDLHLKAPGVSQFHAILEMQDGRLFIRDLGSKNGTAIAGLGRIPPNQLISLSEYNDEFYIAQYFIRLEHVELPPEPAKPRFSVTLDRDRGDLDEHTGHTRPHPAALASRFKSAYDNYRASWNHLFGEIEKVVGRLDDELRDNACQELARAFPPLMNEPEFKNLTTPIPIEEASVVSVRATATRATIAMHGLQQIAASYFPNQHLESPEDFALFLETMKATLDVFFKCFLQLRDGYRAFTRQLDLPTGRAEAPASGRSPTVEHAETAGELAQALLDWKRQGGGQPPRVDPRQAVEWVFADLMIHHMAMITGVMQGVKSLLNELSPPAIERVFDDPKKNPGGLQIGPFRYKQLWDLYAQRHSDLADEDKEAFALIFGPDFARAYSQLTTDTQAVQAIRMSSQFPTRTPSNRPPG